MPHQQSEDATFESRLTDGTDRFLAHMIEHAFTIGRRTSRDFLRHFPPSSIMEALKDSPSLRADILEAATGMRRKVALKKSALSSGEDLQIALEEGEAAPEEVIHLFRADDRVRYLPRGKLWSFLIEGDFWKANKSDKGSYDRAQLHIAFMLDRALKDQVLNYQDVIEGISINKICQLMPRSEVEVAMTAVMSFGRKGQAFSDRDLYDSLSSITLANYIPLPHIWDEVIFPCIAVEHGLSDSLSVHAKVEKVGGLDESGKLATPANTNDPAVAQAQSRLPVNKVVSPAPMVKRPSPVVPVVAPAKVVASKAPVANGEPRAPADEDEAFDVHFDNLTAAKN